MKYFFEKKIFTPESLLKDLDHFIHSAVFRASIFSAGLAIKVGKNINRIIDKIGLHYALYVKTIKNLGTEKH